MADPDPGSPGFRWLLRALDALATSNETRAGFPEAPKIHALMRDYPQGYWAASRGKVIDLARPNLESLLKELDPDDSEVVLAFMDPRLIGVARRGSP